MRVYNFKKSLKMARIILPAYIASLIRPKPIWANMILTRKCNLDCRYCFVKDPTKRDLNGIQTIKVIDKLHSLGCRFIDFTGGEPTLRRDLPELVKHANDKGMMTRITTNGTLLTPDYIEKLARAGLDIMNLSIDSVLEFDQSRKDYVRSKKIIFDLIDAREKYGFEIETNLTLTRKNLDTVIETVELIHNLKIAIAICIIVQNTYSNVQMDQDLFFNTPEDKKKLFGVLDEIKELKRHKYNIIDPSQYFDDIKEFVNHKLDWKCMAGEYSISVDCDGKFQLCYLLPAEEVTVFDIDGSYYRRFAAVRKKRLDSCKKLCAHNCSYDPSYFLNHPFFFLKELLVNSIFQRN